MISEKEFLDAVEIVKAYQAQVMGVLIPPPITIEDYLNSPKRNISVRALNGLLALVNRSDNPIKYIKDIKMKDFLAKNVGRRSWNELQYDVRELYGIVLNTK